MNHRYVYDFPFLATPCETYDLRNKPAAIMHKIKYMLARSSQMFEYTGLPDNLPQRMLELYLQVNGYAVWYRHGDELDVFWGGLGGQPNRYYFPTIATIANPALNLTVQAEIDKDCVVMYNDTMLQGLMPMYSYHATQLVENEISMQLASVNTRIISLLSASDDRTRQAAEKFLKDIYDGKLGVIGENSLFDELNGGVKAQPYATSMVAQLLKTLIEYEQYEKASWYNELGLDANYNMKRETLTDSENAMNRDSLYPLVDDMLHNRQLGLEKVNAMFGTEISVKLASSWEDNMEELELQQEILESEADGAGDSGEEGGADDVDEDPETNAGA